MPNPAESYGEKIASKDAQERANALVIQITDGFLRGDERRAPKDVRPFEELLIHLLPRAELFARATVAQKLATRRDLPRRVLELMLQDDPAVSEPLVVHSKLLRPEDIDMLIVGKDPILRQALLKRDDLTLVQKQALVLNISSLRPQLKIKAEPVAEIKPLVIDIPRHVQAELPTATEIFVEVKTETPASIVLTPLPHTREASPQLVQNMVRAAVLRRPEELCLHIAQAIDLSPIVTQALLKDESGEALIAACHYLNVPEDASIQIATLLYPAVTRSSQLLTNLRKTYRAFSPQATQKIAEAWRTLPYNRAPKHASVHAGAPIPATPAPSAAPAAEEKIASNQ